jgi:Spy/CpxP family protein refolding chaperone
MKKPALLLLFAATLPLTTLRAADSPNHDPFLGAFFPPEMILQAHDQIGMSQQQLETFRAKVEEAQPRSNELKQQLERENGVLAGLIQQEHVDKAALMAQLDKVLDAERGLKHVHLGLLAEIKNLLTPDQQAKLHAMEKGAGQGGEETRARLTAKVNQVQAGVQKWMSQQRDPSAIAQAMRDECQPLLQSGKAAEAEAVLDRLIQQLQAGDK